MTARSVYVEKMKLQLDELNASMTRLEGNAKVAKAEARAKLEEVKAAGEDTWKTMVAEMDKVREAFAQSFNHFKSQI